METKDIVKELLERGDSLSLAAASEIKRLAKKYDDLDEAYDLMSKDFLYVQSEVLRLRKTNPRESADE